MAFLGLGYLLASALQTFLTNHRFRGETPLDGVFELDPFVPRRPSGVHHLGHACSLTLSAASPLNMVGISSCCFLGYFSKVLAESNL